MRTLSLTTILACVGALLLGLGIFILFTSELFACTNPSNGVQHGILGVVEVYDLGYHQNSYTESQHRVTIENGTDSDVEYKYECRHTVVTDDQWENIVVDATREFGPHIVSAGGTKWHFQTRTASLHNVRHNRNYILKTYTALRVTGGPSWDICREYKFTHQ